MSDPSRKPGLIFRAVVLAVACLTFASSAHARRVFLTPFPTSKLNIGDSTFIALRATEINNDWAGAEVRFKYDPTVIQQANPNASANKIAGNVFSGGLGIQFVASQSDTRNGIVNLTNFGGNAPTWTDVNTDTLLALKMYVVGEGATLLEILTVDTNGNVDTNNNIISNTSFSAISVFDSFVRFGVVFLGPDSTAPIVGAGFLADSLFVRGTGKNITSTIFDSSAVAGFDTVSMYADTKATGGALSGSGFRQILGTTTDTGKTRVYTFAVSNAFVASGDSFVYYIAARDTRLNRGTFGDSNATKEITITGGISARIFAGGPVSDTQFNTDSLELVSSAWRDSAGVSRTDITQNQTGITFRIRATDASGLADSIAFWLDTGAGYRFLGQGFFSGGVCSAYISSATNVFERDTNLVIAIIRDTGGAVPDISDTGRIFIDQFAPTLARPDSIINSGGVLTDTRRVTLNFGATGGQKADTNPNGIKFFRFSDTSAGIGTTNAYKYSDTVPFDIPDTLINAVTGVATIFFQLEDDAGNFSAIVSDSIIVDLDSPLIRTDSGANIGNIGQRAKATPISVIVHLRDTSGIASANLYAKHRTDSPNYTTIAMALTTGTVFDGLWTGTIPTSIVGAIADTNPLRGVEYFITCTDVVGRSAKYKDSATPESISIVNGLGVRVFVGSSLNFNFDSRELVSSQWRDSASTRAFFTLDTTVLFTNDPGGMLVRVVESTGLGDTFQITFDTGFGFANNSVTPGQLRIGDSGQISFSGLILSQDTNAIRVEVFDTAGVGIPPFSDDGKFFVDLINPVMARPDSIINSGGVLTDTVAVTFNFGSAGGKATDTSALGVRAFFVSNAPIADTGPGTEFLFTDTKSFSITPDFFNAASGAATLYFRLQDFAGRYSASVADTILVDSIPPIIATGNGGNIGNIGSRAKGQPITVTAYMQDSGGIAATTLYARHRNDSSAYTAIAMTISSGDLRQGVWAGIIPTTIVGAGADTAIGVEFFLQCTDVVGRGALYKSAAAPESIGLVNGVDGRVFTKLPRDTNGATSEYTEITASGELAVKTGISPTLRVSSSIGDTVRVKRTRAGVDSTFQTLFKIDFADTVLILPAASLQQGDSLVVYISDSTVNLSYEDTFFVAIDDVKPVISSFRLDPNRAAIDSTGVRVRVTLTTTEKNIRFFVSQTSDTLGGTLNNATTQFTGNAFDSATATVFPQINLGPISGDTAALFISAWDDAGNVADTVLLNFVIDRAAPQVAIQAIANNRPVSETVTVQATIMDTTSGLGYDTIVLGVTVGGVTDSFAMAKVSGSEILFRGTISASKIGSAAGTVTVVVLASDTFRQKSSATTNFTTSSVSIRLGNGTDTTVGDTLFTATTTAILQVNAPGDTVQLSNAQTAFLTAVLPVDSAQITFGLVAGSNTLTITRTNPLGDSQVYTRFVISDTTAPTVYFISIDSGALFAGNETVAVTFAATGAPAAYRVLGDVTESSSTFIGYSGVETFSFVAHLTTGDGSKGCTVQVRDSAGNISAATIFDTITRNSSLGATYTPTFDSTSGETRAVVQPAANDQISETVTILQGNSDTIVIVLGDITNDTMTMKIDFFDTVRQALVLCVRPDTAGLSTTGDSTGQIGNFALGSITVREITVQDSQGRSIGPDSNTFNSCRLTWNLGAALKALKTALEVFYFDTTTRRWKLARTDSSVTPQTTTDSFVNYATGDTISILVRHFTIFGVFPAGWPTVATTAGVVVYPNPYVPYDGNLANGERGTATEGIRIGNLPDPATIEIYDIRGRKIDAMTVSGTGVAIWDAHNFDNQEVVSGIYLIVVKGNGGTVVRKVAVVR